MGFACEEKSVTPQLVWVTVLAVAASEYWKLNYSSRDFFSVIEVN